MSEGRSQPLPPILRRGIRAQLTGAGLSVVLGFFLIATAGASRLQAALLLLVGLGLVLDGWSLRVSGALLASAQPPRRSWVPWASRLAFVMGAALMACALVILGRSRSAP